MGIEPTSSAWKAEVIAIIRCPHPGTRLPDFSVEFWDGAGLFITRLASFGPAAPCAAQLEPCRRLSPSPPAINRCGIYRISVNRRRQDLVVGEGFEPSKSVTADLQSAPFGRSGTPPWYSWIYKLSFQFYLEETWPVSLLRPRSWRREDGGGGRIRTFEVSDGRFTVCSLWPLGNPTIYMAI